MKTVIEIARIIITSGIIYGLVELFIRPRIDNKYKTKFENLRAELQKLVFEHGILYKKRLRLTEQLCSKIDNVDRAVGVYVQPSGSSKPLEERGKNAYNAMFELMEFYGKNRYFFDNEICLVLDKIINSYETIRIKFAAGKSWDMDIYEYWSEVWSKYKIEIQNMRKRLENLLKKRIGIKGNEEEK